MIDRNVLILLELNFAFVGSLPLVFFGRRGRLGTMWWLNASPFLVCAGYLALTLLGRSEPSVLTPWGAGLPVAGVALSAASFAMVGCAMATHRIPPSVWHQDVTPPELVTWGAYAKIRHPFYSSFILALIAAFTACPHWLTLASLVSATALLNSTAAVEEARLCKSKFAGQYKDYMAHTGRFLPRLTGSSRS